MTLDSFNTFTVTVMPQSVLWKYSCKFYPMLENNIFGVITQIFNKNYLFSLGMWQFFQEYPFFANFTVGMIRNQTGHLLECVKLYGKLINKSET